MAMKRISAQQFKKKGVYIVDNNNKKIKIVEIGTTIKRNMFVSKSNSNTVGGVEFCGPFDPCLVDIPAESEIVGANVQPCCNASPTANHYKVQVTKSTGSWCIVRHIDDFTSMKAFIESDLAGEGYKPTVKFPKTKTKLFGLPLSEQEERVRGEGLQAWLRDVLEHWEELGLSVKAELAIFFREQPVEDGLALEAPGPAAPAPAPPAPVPAPVAVKEESSETPAKQPEAEESIQDQGAPHEESDAALAAALAAADGDGGGGWACPTCTVHNSHDDMECATCGAPHPVVAAAAAEGGATPPPPPPGAAGAGEAAGPVAEYRAHLRAAAGTRGAMDLNRLAAGFPATKHYIERRSDLKPRARAVWVDLAGPAAPQLFCMPEGKRGAKKQKGIALADVTGVYQGYEGAPREAKDRVVVVTSRQGYTLALELGSRSEADGLELALTYIRFCIQEGRDIMATILT